MPGKIGPTRGWGGWIRSIALLVVVAGTSVTACAASERDKGSPESAARSDLAAASEGPSTESDSRRAIVRFPRGHEFVAEIADTAESAARGYMYRTQVGKNDAMIFVFPQSGLHSFWMKNTFVELDIIWMDEEFDVIHIERSVQPCRADPCPSYGPPRKVRYVLEVAGGTVVAEGLVVGDRLEVAFPAQR